MEIYVYMNIIYIYNIFQSNKQAHNIQNAISSQNFLTFSEKLKKEKK